MDVLTDLLKKVEIGNFTLGIVGIGRVGLPLGLVFAKSGVSVYGIDSNKEYVEKLARGEKPFVENGIEDYLKNSNFIPTSDGNRSMEKCDILIFTVGTPLTTGTTPDYSQLRAALEELVKTSIKGKMIIMRSTASPGTVENYMKPFLEKKTGLKCGVGFGLAVCPERILEGKAFEEIVDLPEIIGAMDETSSKIVVELFKKINPNKKFLLTSPKAAELAKLFTNVYRYINFALANEFGLLAEEYGEDAFEIINALNSGYKRGGIPSPGLTGGPCLSKDGYYLIANLTFPDFIIMACRMNEAIPQYIVNKMKKMLSAKGKEVHDSKIALLGLAFKSGSDDTRYSPSLKIIEALKSEHADFMVHDPFVKDTSSLEDAVRSADGVILAINHPQFKELHKKIFNLVKRGCVLVDCWGMLNPTEARKLGFDYIRFGSGKK